MKHNIKSYKFLIHIFRNLLVVLILFSATLKSKAESTSTNLQPRVVTTIGMITDVVKNIGQDRLNITGLINAGVDPHLYKATRSDIALLNSADIIFYNGLLLEGKITDALMRIATSGKKVHPVTQLLDQDYLLEPQGFSGHYDPHVWMDPEAWSKAVDVIKLKLSEYDPAGSKYYETQANKYKEDLKKLDEYGEIVLKSVPEESRILITAHDAFNYFGKRYGYTVRGIQGLSTESEAGVKDIEEVVNEIVSKNIKAVFIENTVSERNIKALIEGAKAKGHTLKIGGELFSDAMGKEGTYEGTYVGMIDHNMTTIALALGGKAPNHGMLGKLNNKQ